MAKTEPNHSKTVSQTVYFGVVLLSEPNRNHFEVNPLSRFLHETKLTAIGLSLETKSFNHGFSIMFASKFAACFTVSCS